MDGTVATDGEERPAVVPNRLRHAAKDWVDPVAVGDIVRLRREREDVVIEEVFPRRNGLSRAALGRGGKRQMIAANLDVAAVVLAAAEPEWKPATIDRYLVLASSADIPGLVVINKIDLDRGVRDRPELDAYRELEMPVVFTSTVTGEGIDVLAAVLGSRTAVLLGPSGAGKTSLLNRLVPGAAGRVDTVSDSTGKGRHTTTWVERMDLPGGGHLIDSPGLRVLDLSGVEPEDLVRHFPEMAGLASGCRFPDCRHRAEPQCAVKAGVEAGAVWEHRYDSYLRIMDSLEKGRG
jgi:ribosome biogenesis GTPase